MCFYRATKHKISEGVICYKVLDDNGDAFYTPIISYKIPYKLGVTIKATKTVVPWWAYFCRPLYRKASAAILDKQQLFFGQVVHAYSTIKEAERCASDSQVIVECLIPKGEVYWENHADDEVAALSIKVVKVIRPKK